MKQLLFSNKEAIEVVTMPDYEAIAEKFDKLWNLREIKPTYQSVNDLESEEDEAHFVQAFRKLMRAMNVLQSYTDFDWEDAY
jgi:type I restriction enzyme R subunit